MRTRIVWPTTLGLVTVLAGCADGLLDPRKDAERLALARRSGGELTARVIISDVEPLHIGERVRLDVRLEFEQGTTVDGQRYVGWGSLDPTVATVNTNGLAIGRALGTARIVASYEGQADTVAVAIVTVADSAGNDSTGTPSDPATPLIDSTDTPIDTTRMDTTVTLPPPAGLWPTAPILPVIPAYANACDTLPGCVAINPGDDWAAKIAAAPEGQRFRVTRGTHARAAFVVPKSRQEFHGDGIVRGGRSTSCSSATVVTGGGTTNQFMRYRDGVAQRGVVVKGFAVTGFTGAYSSTNNAGAMMLFSSVGTVVEHMCFVRNGYAGVTGGPKTVVRYSEADSNRVYGFGAFRAHGSVFTDNRARWNNPSGAFPTGTLSAVAGFKLLESDSVTLVRNYAANNFGTNIWFDAKNRWIRADSNTAINGRKGLWAEISPGPISFKYNYVTGAGTGDGSQSCPTNWVDAAAILASNSGNVEVAYNYVAGGCDGIVGTESPRTDNPSLLRNFYAHDNSLVGTRQTAAGLAWSGTTDRSVIYAPASGNRFERNRYALPSLTVAAFYRTNAPAAWAPWQAAGQDTAGSITTTP